MLSAPTLHAATDEPLRQYAVPIAYVMVPVAGVTGAPATVIVNVVPVGIVWTWNWAVVLRLVRAGD